MYVFDTSPITTLFKNYYPSRFPTLWGLFHGMVSAGRIVSTREVLREVQDGPVQTAREWAESTPSLFTIPNTAEGAMVARIFAVPHFQQNIEMQKILKGGRNADPFVAAKASVVSAAVVTVEAMRPNSAKLPNICHHFSIECLSLEEFMERESWSF